MSYLFDKELSFTAKGILSYLIQRKAMFVSASELMNVSKCTGNDVENALTELVENGYLRYSEGYQVVDISEMFNG